MASHQRHSGRRKGRLHDGKVVVMRSNLRWCSNLFEITCWNDDIVRIVFVIDAHDREVPPWHAAAGRLGGTRSDAGGGGSYASARSKRHTLSSGGPTTVVASPLQRRSTSPLLSAWRRASPRCRARSRTALPKRSSKRSTATALASIHCRMLLQCDYNESHPHSGLGMTSPRQFNLVQAK
jgi:putative transposase